MMMQAPTAFSVLFCTCIVGVLSTCSNSGPGDCYFGSQYTCDWTPTSAWSVYRGYNYYNYFLGLNVEHNTEERVESRTACSTNNSIHCLMFRYSFLENNVLNLSVIIKTSELGEQEVWRMSSCTSPNYWSTASVPVNTSTEVTVIFEAWGSDSHRVFIDTIDYDKEVCNVQPPAATPPPVATSSTSQPTSTTSAVETTTFTTETTTATSFSTETTTVTTVFTTSITSPTTGHQEQTSQSTKSDSAPTTVSQAGRAAPADSFSDVGLIVGVVVAVVLLIVIGVVLCILFKRKQSHDWKTCFRTKKGKEEDFHVSASHNAAYSLDDIEPHQFISVDINPVNPEHGMQQQGHYDSLFVAPPAEDYYSVIETPAEGPDLTSSTVECAEMNKAKDFSNTAQGHQSSDESPYEIGDLCEPGLYQNTVVHSEAHDQQQETALYQNVPSTPDTQGHH